MLEHTESIEIDRDPHEVYAFIADAANDPRWRQEVISSELIEGEAGQPGARYRQVMQQGRREMTSTHEIVAADPPRRIEWRTPPGEGPLDFAGTYTVEPQDTGARVSLETRVRARGLFRLAQPFMGRFLRKVSARYARDLKSSLEQP